MAPLTNVRYMSAANATSFGKRQGACAMFDSLPSLGELLLSNGNRRLPDKLVDAPLRIGQALVTPEEPSTLALAAVGIATVGIYLAARGWRRSRRSLTDARNITRAAPSRRPTDGTPTRLPKRGAA
jgi:hypothetical protein